MAEVRQDASHELCTLYVVECKEAREKQVVLPDTCSTASTIHRRTTHQEGHVRSGIKQRIESALQAQDEGVVILLLAQEIARSLRRMASIL